MAQGNKDFAAGLAGRLGDPEPGPGAAARLPPRTSILTARDNRLADLASGNAVTRFHELVDPAQCRVWEGHNRDYATLSEETCADLIESFKAQGRQEVPAIVRRVAGDPKHGYEVICGARRHWAASWMRTHDYPDFKFLIEPRELTDEEAFRLADLENRSRRDLSDYERARDYARAVERYYGGSQQRMAERLEVTKSWLSRYLELAKLPTEIVAAFASPHVLGIRHGATLAPLLRVANKRERMLAEAGRILAEQIELATGGSAAIVPAAVLARFISAARSRVATRKPAASGAGHVVRAPDGAVIARSRRTGRGGGITISLPAPARHDRDALLRALAAILDHVISTAKGGVKPDR